MDFMPRPRANLAWGGTMAPGVRSWKAILRIANVCEWRSEMALDSGDL